VAPGETLTMAAGLPLQTLLPYGREPTSMAFFSAAGMERLYSGVKNSTPSCRPSLAERPRLRCRGAVSSRSWL
jgi:hypothetical protein